MADRHRVSRNLLRRYLLSSHWNVTLSKDTFELFERESIEIVLPRADIDRRTESALLTLSQFEGRTVDEVLETIVAVGYDQIRSRLPDSSMRGGGVPLEIAATFVERARGLLMSTATNEIAPQRSFRRNRKDAIDYANRCVFGHTFQGSFGFVIESPVSPNDAPTLLGSAANAPFERKVVERLVRGMSHVEKAVAADSIDPVVSGHEAGLNANMCEDLATLVGSVSPTGITIQVAFSPEWKPSLDIEAAKSEFVLGHKHAEVAEEAAKKLRKIDIELNRTVHGKVRRLESKSNPLELLASRGAREIAVEWETDDLGTVLVRVVLEPRDYLLALEAHKRALPVSISGRLDRKGRNWTLVDHGLLTIVGADEQSVVEFLRNQ